MISRRSTTLDHFSFPSTTRRKLASVPDTRRALSQCLRALELDLVEPSKAAVLIEGYRVLADMIRELERRAEPTKH